MTEIPQKDRSAAIDANVVTGHTRRWWRRGLAVLVGAVAVTAAGLGVGMWIQGHDTTAPVNGTGFSSVSTPPKTMAELDAEQAQLRAQIQRNGELAVAREAASPSVVMADLPDSLPARGPATSIGEGTFEVGTDIEPGTYKTTGPAQTTCYWFRLRDTTGEGPSIASDGTRGPATVTIKKSDAAFRTSGCSTWQKVR